MMDEHERRMIVLAMSAIGGSIVSLWSLPWRKMAWREIAFTMTVGFVFAIFGVPWLVADIMGVDITPLRVACGTTFFGAAFGVPLMPIIWREFLKRAGLKREEEA